MLRRSAHRLMAIAILFVTVIAMPLVVNARDGAWIDQIVAMVKDHQELARSEGREAAYYPLLGQLMIVRSTFGNENPEATALAVNRLMDMLEADAKGGGIPIWSAKVVFDFCGTVTPAAYHDATRHQPGLTGGGFDYWDDEVYDPGAGG